MIEAYIFIVGLFFGSFLNVLADRLPCGKSIMGRSHCDSCKHILSWKDLFPIISFAYLKGKCRYCKASLSIQYPLSEIFTGVIFLLTWNLSNQWYHSPVLHGVHLVIAATLIVLFLSDLRYYILPDEMQILLLLSGIARMVLIYQGTVGGELWPWVQYFGQAFLYGLLTMAPLLAVFAVTKGKGMGFGDVKLAFTIGFVLGVFIGFGALYLAFILGGITGTILLILRKKGKKSMIPFGPFLVMGFYIMLFYEHEVVYWLGKLYGF